MWLVFLISIFTQFDEMNKNGNLKQYVYSDMEMNDSLKWSTGFVLFNT